MKFPSLSLGKSFGLGRLFFKSKENKIWKTHAFCSAWNECNVPIYVAELWKDEILLTVSVPLFKKKYNHSIHGKHKEKNCRSWRCFSLHLAQAVREHESPASSQALLGMGAGPSMGAAAAVLEGSQNPDTAFWAAKWVSS